MVFGAHHSQGDGAGSDDGKKATGSAEKRNPNNNHNNHKKSSSSRSSSNVNTSYSGSSSGTSNTVGQYLVLPIGDEGREFTVFFACQAEVIQVLCARPVLCCGGEFVICPSAGGCSPSPGQVCNGVSTRVNTTNVEHLAAEIGRRLMLRGKQGDAAGAAAAACPLM